MHIISGDPYESGFQADGWSESDSSSSSSLCAVSDDDGDEPVVATSHRPRTDVDVPVMVTNHKPSNIIIDEPISRLERVRPKATVLNFIRSQMGSHRGLHIVLHIGVNRRSYK